MLRISAPLDDISPGSFLFLTTNTFKRLWCFSVKIFLVISCVNFRDAQLQNIGLLWNDPPPLRSVSRLLPHVPIPWRGATACYLRSPFLSQGCRIVTMNQYYSPIRSAGLRRVFGFPSGGRNKTLISPVDPTVAALCLSQPDQTCKGGDTRNIWYTKVFGLRCLGH